MQNNLTLLSQSLQSSHATMDGSVKTERAVFVIYFIQDESLALIKIGFTDGDPRERVKALQTGSPSRLVLLFSIAGDEAEETSLHHRFSAARVHGEWFRPVPSLIRFLLDAYSEKITFTDASPSPIVKRARRQAAIEWLIARFDERDEWKSEELFLLAKVDHISRNAIFQAKQDLKLVKVRKETNESGETYWIWRVCPADWSLAAQLKEENGHV